MNRRMLTREEEASIDDIDVRKEDQDKINKFSRLHHREQALQEELRHKQKEKEDLEEVSTEIELVDEDQKVPYKIGDSFVYLPLEEAQEMLEKASQQIDQDVDELDSKLASHREEMDALKAELYARFGKGINLET